MLLVLKILISLTLYRLLSRLHPLIRLPILHHLILSFLISLIWVCLLFFFILMKDNILDLSGNSVRHWGCSESLFVGNDQTMSQGSRLISGGIGYTTKVKFTVHMLSEIVLAASCAWTVKPTYSASWWTLKVSASFERFHSVYIREHDTKALRL